MQGYNLMYEHGKQIQFAVTQYGISKVIQSDNGTNYKAEYFKGFVDSWDIDHQALQMHSPTV